MQNTTRTRSRHISYGLTLGLVSLLALGQVAAATPPHRRTRPYRKPAPVNLVWHVETMDGSEVSSVQGDLPVNPASVVKVATTLWALEKLGPGHRFDTVFLAMGDVDVARGVLNGDLVVQGTGDPDFHVENAFLMAARLNEIGVRQVRGKLRVNDKFWIGWEGGSERTLQDPVARASLMAQRLRAALDPARWNAGTRRAWREFAARYSLPATRPPTVVVVGGVGFDPGKGQGAQTLFTHRSKTLVEILRRFDCFSNNDIERLEVSLGPATELAQHLVQDWQVSADTVRFETISGLGTNRMTSRHVVRLLRALRETCERLGLAVESVLPVAGCDPGTLNHSFARLCNGPNAMSVVAKTGTLTSTDGGTAVLAGFVSTGRGDLAFSVAAPRAAGRLRQARSAEQRWVEELIAKFDGPRPRKCMGPLRAPEEGAEILWGHSAFSSNSPAAPLAQQDGLEN